MQSFLWLVLLRVQSGDPEGPWDPLEVLEVPTIFTIVLRHYLPFTLIFHKYVEDRNFTDTVSDSTRNF